MTSPLEQASALLDGTLRVGTHSVRAAAWIVRSALEDVVVQLVETKGLRTGNASMRTLLGCVEVLYEKEDNRLAFDAQYAWDTLSRAAHQHAYELSPTHGEVAALAELVRVLDSHLSAPTMPSSFQSQSG